MRLNLEQRKLARELALASGFGYDPYSNNILSPDEGCWCNRQVWNLVEAVLANKEDFDAIATEELRMLVHDVAVEYMKEVWERNSDLK